MKVLAVKHNSTHYYTRHALREVTKLINKKDDNGNYLYSIQQAIDHLRYKGWKILNSIEEVSK